MTKALCFDARQNRVIHELLTILFIPKTVKCCYLKGGCKLIFSYRAKIILVFPKKNKGTTKIHFCQLKYELSLFTPNWGHKIASTVPERWKFNYFHGNAHYITLRKNNKFHLIKDKRLVYIITIHNTLKYTL